MSGVGRVRFEAFPISQLYGQQGNPEALAEIELILVATAVATRIEVGGDGPKIGQSFVRRIMHLRQTVWGLQNLGRLAIILLGILSRITKMMVEISGGKGRKAHPVARWAAPDDGDGD